MKNIFKILFFAITAMFLASCNTNKYCENLKKDSDGLTVIRLLQQWFASSDFAGEIFAKEYTAKANGIKLEVIPGSEQLDAIQIVKSGEAEFGVAGADLIMLANEKGADLVVVGVVNYKTLACFISKKEKNIISPNDMAGHKIGTLEGSAVDIIYQAMKKKFDLDIKKEDEIPAGWLLTDFIQDQYDVYPAFINNEPVILKHQDIDVNIIQPSLYGVDFIGTVYFCKRELVECCPKIVQNFVNAISEGWEMTMNDPKKAVELLKKYDENIDEEKEIESLLTGLDYYKGEDGKILYAKEETWNTMAEQLQQMGLLKSFEYKSTVENKFVDSYLSKAKK
ncbi:MAG TPA: ABC transporter substrate-binding protein [Desulfobacteraceae bacterium]|nr:ABC transporter substrate-binding protein [Bacteroidales bacterium]HPQ29831.1 ABC transporter substrate-binding protein [Desulfobacteraceae bacterium]HRW94521.1 ABC transporter substrate-binding protein [Bacteroidales bacterium]